MNIFREPAEPLALFSYSDILILLMLNSFAVIFWKYNLVKDKVILNVILIISFAIVIPYISGNIEADNVHHKYTIVDGFNLLYIFLKWPVWWILGVINIVLLSKYCFKKA